MIVNILVVDPGSDSWKKASLCWRIPVWGKAWVLGVDLKGNVTEW